MDKTYKNGKVWRHCEFGSITLEPWLVFLDKQSFTEVIKNFCVQEGFGVFLEKSDPQRFIARCAIDGCNWRIHASTMPDKTSAVTYSSQSRHSSRVFAKNMYGKVQNSCEKRLFYKVKAVSKEMIHGGFGEAYSLLPRYAEMVKETNPGSYALVTWTQLSANVQPRFKACFFSFAAQVRGFLRGCRPIIGIDGAHLSGYYKGILLTAVGIDGNNEIFVFAYGISKHREC
ncbi:uncharacterized protein LOC110685445 [Chenopodium quinoa]|uniref:uncharacterized protein LOC110685445 n=1 Tax=Chenopodium quinoa TaxID=63459 RepID=UPI000B7818AF|nr:uncharacterized protein LOC110685445 [Chenopodium quinoa]